MGSIQSQFSVVSHSILGRLRFHCNKRMNFGRFWVWFRVGSGFISEIVEAWWVRNVWNQRNVHLIQVRFWTGLWLLYDQLCSLWIYISLCCDWESMSCELLSVISTSLVGTLFVLRGWFKFVYCNFCVVCTFICIHHM